MDAESQELYNDTIDTRELIHEDFQKKADSLGGNSHTVHTSSYRSHTISSSTGLANNECTDEIIEFNFD